MLRDAPFVLSHPVSSPQIYASQIAWCDEAGFRPENVRYASSTLESRFLVACGLGVGFAYESNVGSSAGGIVFLPLMNHFHNNVIEFYLNWLMDRQSRLVQDLLKCLIDNVHHSQVIHGEHGFELEWKRLSSKTRTEAH